MERAAKAAVFENSLRVNIQKFSSGGFFCVVAVIQTNFIPDGKN
jgi:hypothetical protein